MASILDFTDNFIINCYNFNNAIMNDDYHAFTKNVNDANAFLMAFQNINDVNYDANSFNDVGDVHNLVNYSVNYSDDPIPILVLLLMHYICYCIIVPFIIKQIILIIHHPFVLSIALLFLFYKYKERKQACF